jgi:flagellar assembly protein FliH
MLSKVLSGRDAERAHPMSLATVILNSPEIEPQPDKQPEPPKEAPPDPALLRENKALHDRLLHVEAELAAAKRDLFEQGRRQGDQQARAELTPIVERLGVSLSEITDLRQEIRLKAEKDMVQLALLIAKRILHRELNVDTNALTALARVVFERLVRAETWRVTVHPRFATAIAGALGPGQTGRVQIEPDPNCPPGTLVVRSDEGKIDASVEAQLEEIARGLTDRIGRGRNS